MSDNPKFLYLISRNGVPTAWMTDGFGTEEYEMSASDCSSSIEGWTRLLQSETADVKGNAAEEKRVRDGITQFKIALSNIERAQKTGSIPDVPLTNKVKSSISGILLGCLAMIPIAIVGFVLYLLDK